MANLASISISALNSAATASPLDNFGTAGFIISGTWSGTITFEGSLDGISFIPMLAQNLQTIILSQTTTSNGQFIINTAGLYAVRARFSSYTSGTASITIQANAITSINRTLNTIIGATNSNQIGNVGDRLKVDTTITASNGSVPTVNKKLRYDDMNASVGGVARGTIVTNSTWVNVYNYSGMGILTSMVLNLEDKNNWQIRMVIDGEEVFGANGLFTSDLVSDTAYDLDDAGSPLSTNEGNIGISLEEHDRFVWVCPTSFPIRYETSAVIKVKRIAAQASKKFQAGLIILTKE